MIKCFGKDRIREKGIKGYKNMKIFSKDNPKISVIVSCFNEESFIKNCLNSLIGQDYPKDNLEILFIDGMSNDETRKIIKNYSEKYSFVKLLDNPNRITPCAFNIGIKESRGDAIFLLGAHAKYEKDYISKCVEHLKESGADNVGGIIKTIPKDNSIIAKSIAFCLSHPFGVGSSFFRMDMDKPREVDTVFGGCYKKEIFDKVGLFNEKLKRSQDIELNSRIRKEGGKIMLFPDIVSYYYPQTSLTGFLKHNFQDGIWSTYPLKFDIKIFSFRHLIPLIFVSFLLISSLLGLVFSFFSFLFYFVFSLYLLAIIVFSFSISKREKDWDYLFVMPIVFLIRHFGYGLGSLWGLIKSKIK